MNSGHTLSPSSPQLDLNSIPLNNNNNNNNDNNEIEIFDKISKNENEKFEDEDLIDINVSDNKNIEELDWFEKLGKEIEYSTGKSFDLDETKDLNLPLIKQPSLNSLHRTDSVLLTNSPDLKDLFTRRTLSSSPSLYPPLLQLDNNKYNEDNRKRKLEPPFVFEKRKKFKTHENIMKNGNNNFYSQKFNHSEEVLFVEIPKEGLIETLPNPEISSFVTTSIKIKEETSVRYFKACFKNEQVYQIGSWIILNLPTKEKIYAIVRYFLEFKEENYVVVCPLIRSSSSNLNNHEHQSSTQEQSPTEQKTLYHDEASLTKLSLESFQLGNEILFPADFID